MKERIKVSLMSICSTLAIGLNAKIFFETLKKSGALTDAFNTGLTAGLFGTLILFILLYRLYLYKKPVKSSVIAVLSGIFSFLMIFGFSYMSYGTSFLVLGNISKFLMATLQFLGYYFIFNYGLSFLFNYLDKHKFKDVKNKFVTYFKEHPFKVSMIIMLVCWAPYIIAFYPIILSPDPSFQIRQFFGIRTKYADYVPLISEKMQITNHHPVIHTLLLGSCLFLGHKIGNDNLGLFLYSIIQIGILASVLAYSLKYMVQDMKVNVKWGLICLAIYALVPVFPFYAMSGVKDVIFSSMVILYLIMLHKTLHLDKITFKEGLKLVLVMLLVILFRNNGLYVVALSFPFLILVNKRGWKPLLIVLLITLGLSTTYSKVILPYFKITPGSIREMLSIPFQQTARLVKYHSEDISEYDKQVIDKVLVYDTLKDRYDPELADDVKNKFNPKTTKEDLNAYFKVWFKGLLKHPNTYIDATVNNVYGFFYPEKTNWYIYHNFDKRITDNGFDYHYNNLEWLRDGLTSYGETFPYIPVLGLIVNIAVNTWLVFILIGYAIYKNWYKELVLYLPAVISILVCVAGPANTYYRYALPYIMAMPLMIGFVLEHQK